jgi:hypothetical protein
VTDSFCTTTLVAERGAISEPRARRLVDYLASEHIIRVRRVAGVRLISTSDLPIVLEHAERLTARGATRACR